jgi:hypothetical protein
MLVNRSPDHKPHESRASIRCIFCPGQSLCMPAAFQYPRIHTCPHPPTRPYWPPAGSWHRRAILLVSMTCKLYKGRVLLIFLVIFTLPLQMLPRARSLHRSRHLMARRPPCVRRLAPTHASASRPPKNIVSGDSGSVRDSGAVSGGAHVEYPNGVQRGVEPAAAARLSGAGHPYLVRSKAMGTSQRRAARRPGIRHGRVANHPRWPCRLDHDHARACVGGKAPQEAAPVGAASSGHLTVGLLRRLRPQPLGPAGRATLWRARSLLHRDLHPIPLMQTREHPLRGFELQAVAIRRP